MYDLLLTDVTVLTDTGSIPNQCIGIRDGYIQHIGAMPTGDLPESKDILAGRGMLATPGLVNTHTHISMGLYRNYADDLELMEWLETAIWPAEAKLVDEHIYWGTQLGIAEMLRSGTTCFSDMYFFMDTTARVVDQTGMRAVLSRGLAGVAPNAAAFLPENEKLFHDWHGHDNDRIKVMLGPHAPYTCPDSYLREVIDTAHRIGAQIHMHISETQGEVEAVRARTGMTPIAHLDSLGLFDVGCLAAHCVHVEESDMEIMARKRVRVAHNPQSNLKLASGIAPVPAMLAHGITVGLGTDGSASNNNADMLEEVRLAAMLHKAVHYDPKAIPAATAFRLGTVEGAKALDYHDLGLLEVGQRADIVLYDTSGLHWQPRYNDMSSLVYAAQSSDVDTTVVAGRVLMRGKELLTIDEEKLVHEITRLSHDFR